VALDGSPEELALCRLGRETWRTLAPELGAGLEWSACGTLWLAADAEELALAGPRLRAFRAAGVAAELVDARQLRELEPCVAPQLAGGLRVPGDAVIYPPAGARLLAQRAQALGARLRTGQRVAALVPGGVRLEDGSTLGAGQVLLAAGTATRDLLPAVPLRPRKGHLAISTRQPGFLRHQLLETGYLKSAHAGEADSVAFNLQPRPNGQLLLGSSRQYGDEGTEIRATLLRRMLQRALAFVPALAEVPLVRVWTGFRPATPDQRPLIGPVPGRPGVFLACGHEGLGITTAPATAALVAAAVLGRPAPLDPAPYLPSRFPELCHG
jgi:glycine/D-amino acid oxidase-like deaminating enzyme